VAVLHGSALLHQWGIPYQWKHYPTTRSSSYDSRLSGYRLFALDNNTPGHAYTHTSSPRANRPDARARAVAADELDLLLLAFAYIVGASVCSEVPGGSSARTPLLPHSTELLTSAPPKNIRIDVGVWLTVMLRQQQVQTQ